MKRCFPFHNWRAWVDVAEGTRYSPYTGGTTGYYIRQERRCECCNKVQIRIRDT